MTRLLDTPISTLTGDGEFLYFGNAADQGVYRVPLVGGEPTFIGRIEGWFPTAIVLDDENVYFVASGDEHALLYRVAKTGGELTQLSSFSWSSNLALGGDWLYLAAQQDSQMWRERKTDGVSEVLVSDIVANGSPLDTDESYVYFAGSYRSGDRFGLAYYRLPLDGGTADLLVLVATPGENALDLGVEGERLVAQQYVFSPSGSHAQLISAPKGGGEPVVIAEWNDFRGAMDVAAGRVAFAEGGDQFRIRTAPVAGGRVRTIAKVAPFQFLHYDGTCIYFGSGAFGAPPASHGIYVVAD